MNLYKNSIVIIPARGGSKRLPNKNILKLGNLPLIAHSINYAKANNLRNIFVSTDSEEIKSIALSYGSKVIDRPANLATDITSTLEVLMHAVEIVNSDFEDVIVLQPTSPLRPINLLEEAYKKYTLGNYNSLFSVSRNYQKFGKIKNETFTPFNYEIGQRSQDLEPLYYENGLIYISKKQLILKGEIIDNSGHPFLVNHPFSNIDIDTQEEFDLAEYYYNKYNNEK